MRQEDRDALRLIANNLTQEYLSWSDMKDSAGIIREIADRYDPAVQAMSPQRKAERAVIAAANEFVGAYRNGDFPLDMIGHMEIVVLSEKLDELAHEIKANGSLP